MTNFERVKHFMQVFGQDVHTIPQFPDEKTARLRIELIAEELNEFIEAVDYEDIVQVADALTDILYVTYGAGAAFAIDLDACFDQVQRSNMSKLGEDGKPIYREDGKVLKGPNYSPSDLAKVLEKQNVSSAD